MSSLPVARREVASSAWRWPSLTCLATLFGLSLAPMALAEAHDAQTITAHGISTFGDLKYPAGFAHFDYVNPDAPKGGTMSFRGTGASNTFDSVHQFILKGEPAQGLGLLHDTLLVGSADEPDSAYGMVAQSIEYPEDRSWVIFTMHPEATFSDGSPLRASDVVFSYNILLEEGLPLFQISYQDIAAAEALGPHQVKFTFKDGVNTKDLIQTAGGIPILSEAYYADRDFAESTMDPPVTSGGYLIAEADPGRSIRYCKNPDYWAWDHPTNVGQHNFDCVIYEYFADMTAAFEALKSGNYMFHEEFFSRIWATGYDFPAVENGWVVRDSIPDARPSGTQGYWINLRREKFSDPRMRQAIGMMFNFEWSNETLFYGLYKRTTSFWQNSTMMAEGLPEGKELALLEKYADQLPPGVLTEPAFVPAINSVREGARASLKAASDLLDAAGWTLVDGRRRNAEGEVLELSIMDDNPAFERISNPYIENLKGLGIEARLDMVDSQQNEQRQEDFDYDIIPGRLVMSLTPGLELRNIFGSQSATRPGTPNYSGVNDPVIDALIEEVIAADTREDLEIAVRALDRVLRAMHIWVPQWYKGEYNLAYWDIFGRPDIQPLYARGEGTWWIDTAKYDALKAQGAPLP